jgi:hypothetical protein
VAPDVVSDVAAYLELVQRGRTPGDDLAERIANRGPLVVLEEEARVG